MIRNGPLALLLHTAITCFALLPLVVVVLVAFTPENTLSMPWAGLSLRWFYAIFDNALFVDAFGNSLLLGVVAATLSTLFAVPASLAVSRYRFAGAGALNALFLSPLIIPHLVLGVALVRLFSLIGVTGSFSWLILAHVTIITPYCMRLILSALNGFDENAEHAARTLGASEWTVFRRITLPLLLPGICGGWLLAFINSFDELTMSIFITSPTTYTLPVRMYMYASESIDPMMAAISALMIVLTAIAMFVIDRLFGLDRLLVGKG